VNSIHTPVSIDVGGETNSGIEPAGNGVGLGVVGTGVGVGLGVGAGVGVGVAILPTTVKK
jgi:hypothetical protein